MKVKLKNSEKCSYIIEAAMLVACILFFVTSNITPELFKSYYLAFFLGALAIFARLSMGSIRNKNHLSDSAVRVVIASCLLYFIVTNFCGIVLGFNRSYASLKINVIFAAFVPTLLQIVFTEHVRFKISSSFTNSRKPLIFFTILSILLQFVIMTDFRIFNDVERSFIYLSSVILPMIGVELCSAYLSYNFGIRPALTMRLAIQLYPYIFPIVPNLGPYLQSVFSLFLSFLVFISCSKLRIYYDKDKSRFTRYSLGVLTIPLIIICGLLAILVSGIFNYKIIAIGSNSMSPLYERGDAVIFKKVKAQEVQKGDILVFDNGYKIVTHRVVKIDNTNNELSFITKGDANNAEDTQPVPADKVLGTVELYTKYIGFPTLWFNDLINKK